MEPRYPTFSEVIIHPLLIIWQGDWISREAFWANQSLKKHYPGDSKCSCCAFWVGNPTPLVQPNLYENQPVSPRRWFDLYHRGSRQEIYHCSVPRCRWDGCHTVGWKSGEIYCFKWMLYTVDTRWWQLKYFLFPPRKLGKISSLTNIFQMGWFNHQPEMGQMRQETEDLIQGLTGFESVRNFEKTWAMKKRAPGLVGVI